MEYHKFYNLLITFSLKYEHVNKINQRNLLHISIFIWSIPRILNSTKFISMIKDSDEIRKK